MFVCARLSQVKGTGLCLTALSGDVPDCSNVWGRVLNDGSVGLAFVNNAGVSGNVTCNAACFAQLGLPARTFTVRDVWQHADIGVLTPEAMVLSGAVAAQGGSRLFRLTPQ